MDELLQVTKLALVFIMFRGFRIKKQEKTDQAASLFIPLPAKKKNYLMQIFSSIMQFYIA